MWIGPMLTPQAQRIRIGLILGSFGLLCLLLMDRSESEHPFETRANDLRRRTIIQEMDLLSIRPVESDRIVMTTGWDLQGKMDWSEFKALLEVKLQPEFEVLDQETTTALILREKRHAEIHDLAVSHRQQDERLHVQVQYTVVPW